MSRYNYDPSAGGVKQDLGKTRWSLLPDQLLEGVIAVLQIGSEKYSDWNWAKGMPYSRVYDSLRRHLNAFWQGEDLDPETKLPHLDHLICNAIFLKYFFDRYPDLDDRPIHLKGPQEPTTQPAAPQGDSSTTPPEATPSNRAQTASRDVEGPRVHQSGPLQGQAMKPDRKARQEWNPPPPGSALFEIPTLVESEAPELTGVHDAVDVADTDERPSVLSPVEERHYNKIVQRRRMNPGQGLPPID